MHPQPSPDAAALRHRSSPDLTYLPGSMPPQPSHAKPEHRVTASRAAHLLWTPCGAPQTMVSLREEVRGEEARGIWEKKRPGIFVQDKALSAAASATTGPSSLAPLPSPPRPRRHLRVPSPWRSPQQRSLQWPVWRLSGAVSSTEANYPHERDEISSWQRRYPSPPHHHFVRSFRISCRKKILPMKKYEVYF